MRTLPKLVLVLFTFASAAFGQGLPSAEDAWRERNHRGNRYEGINFGRPISIDTAVELWSAHRNPLPDVSKGSILLVSFFLPRGSSPELVVREIQPRFYYRLETIPPMGGWKPGTVNVFGGWDTATVLDPYRIRAEHLAYRVLLKGIPSEIEHYAVSDLGAPRGSPSRPVRLVFVPKRRFAEVRYELRQGCGPATKLLSEGDIGAQFPGVPFPVDVPASTGARVFQVSLHLISGQSSTSGLTIERRYCIHAEED